MTTKEFYKWLKDSGYHWKVGLPFKHAHGWRSVYIRCPCGRGSKKELCPITAVAFSYTSKYYAQEDYLKAAKAIGLRKREAKKIVDAADCEKGFSKKIRQKLLKTVKKDG